MYCRTFRILFLSFLCLWLGVIVPGHERGQITLPGPAHVQTVRACCAMRGGSLSKLEITENTGKKQRPSREDQKRCALCQFIATLQIAQPPLLLLPPMGLLAITPPQRSGGICQPAFAGPVLGRAPPLA